MKIFQLLLIAIFMFILNIWLYYTSEGYREFLQNIKWEKIVENINDEYKIEEKEIEKSLEDELNEKVINNKEEVNKELNSKDSLIEKIEFVHKKVNIDLEESDYFKTFLKNFSKYNLTSLDITSPLMDVTNEYPDKYFEYYSPELTIYNFPTKNYDEVREIFEIESNWNNFTINEVDNFWEESFYINLWKDYKDNFIRIILLKENNVIWIKVSKNEYNSIKNIIK